MAEVEKDLMSSTFPDNSSTRDVTSELPLTRPQLDSVQKPIPKVGRVVDEQAFTE